MLKKTVVVAFILGLLVAAFGFYNNLVVNPGVADEIREQPNGERASIVALLTFADGTEIPVNYLHEGNLVFLGADGPWWRKFPARTETETQGAKVTLLIKGATLTGFAKVVLDDPAYTKEIFARLRPNAPAWLPDWLNGKLIVIQVGPALMKDR